jgi:hypothetical protein
LSVEVVEVNTSRSFGVGFTEGDGERKYVVRCVGEADPITAIVTAVAADAPFYWNNMSRQEFNVTNSGGDIYEVVVPYKYSAGGGDGSGSGSTGGNMPDPTQTPGGAGTGPGGSDPSTTPSGPATADDPIGPNFSWEIGGRPPKLYTSLATLASYGYNDEDVPDHGGSINVQPDGKVEGVDVPDPNMVLTGDFTVDSVSWAYLQRLADMMWHVNDAAWFQFAEGEVALMGASFRTDNQGRGSLSLRLGIVRATVIPIDGIRTDLPTIAVDVPGWYYVWTQFRTEYDATAKRSSERPFALYVVKILPEADFSDLGIGS